MNDSHQTLRCYTENLKITSANETALTAPSTLSSTCLGRRVDQNEAFFPCRANLQPSQRASLQGSARERLAWECDGMMIHHRFHSIEDRYVCLRGSYFQMFSSQDDLLLHNCVKPKLSRTLAGGSLAKRVIPISEAEREQWVCFMHDAARYFGCFLTIFYLFVESILWYCYGVEAVGRGGFSSKIRIADRGELTHIG